jgi:hypothetical protein
MARGPFERNRRFAVPSCAHYLPHRFLHSDIPESARIEFLELFPASARVYLVTGATAVLQCMAGRPKSARKLRTVRSRRLHYFLFCHAVGLSDNLLLENVPQARRNAQMALYAVHLASGGNLYCRAIKAATIGNYLRDVAQFLARFLVVDVRKVDATQLRLAPVIQSILDEVSRWEKVPDKREPFTPAMWAHMHAASTQVDKPHSLGASLCDWFGCGLFGGFRLTEWAQEAGASSILSPLLDDRGVPRAFCLPDIEFRLANNKRTSQREAFDLPDKFIHRARIIFTHQKNGNNGEQRVFVRNANNSTLCFVTLLLRVFKRFIFLLGWEATATPLAIYQTPTGNICAITADDINVAMRATAAAVYGLHPTKHARELQLWSSHSLRVGACVVLHAHGFTGPQIQFLLRWKSDAFMAYLRNLGFLAVQQNVALSDSCDMPNLL